MSRVHEFRLDVADPVDVVFDWHRRTGALARLLPPWQPVRIVQEAADLRDGVTVLGFPAGRTWVAQHLADEYVDGRQFADRLTSRPFVLPIAWHHRHDFEADGSGSAVVDRVTTAVPDAFLREMFAFRHRQLAADLAAHRRTADLPHLTVAVTGSSGLVGSALVPFLTTGGHRVVRLVRRPPSAPDERRWDPERPDAEALAGIDAVIHLAGAPIAGRFTAQHKERIRSSRVGPTRLLAEAARTASVPVFVSASAIGFYGADRGDEAVDEGAAPGEGFLAEVVRDWEAAALVGAESGSAMRVVLIRTGIVQSPRGGALRLQRPLFAAGVGGPIGNGRQWVSWIGIDDLLDIYLRALTDPGLHGAVNAVAPEAVRQKQYAATLGRVMHRPAVLPTPRLGPRILLGREGEHEVALASQRVVPTELLDRGHTFRFPQLEPALAHLLGGSVGAS
ncbi:MAG TPA: TIGR01777 family oxidoreductase [Aeromicrobium sp.]|nr:TIGR01777 family oxidoreductase [Aeromicrobium sp.]